MINQSIIRNSGDTKTPKPKNGNTSALWKNGNGKKVNDPGIQTDAHPIQNRIIFIQ
jgi:hypothetical protein